MMFYLFRSNIVLSFELRTLCEELWSSSVVHIEVAAVEFRPTTYYLTYTIYVVVFPINTQTEVIRPHDLGRINVLPFLGNTYIPSPFPLFTIPLEILRSQISPTYLYLTSTYLNI